ncbi:MAG: M15 family metallopeptidase, partial [Bacteroidota bacterium]
EEGTGEQEEGEEDSFDELPEPDINIEGEIEDVITDEEDGSITVIDSEGNETEIDPETADENEDGDIVIEDDNGDTYIVDEGGNVSGPHNSGGDTGGEENAQDSLNVQEELIKEVLVYYKEEINLWIENYEKGPLDNSIIKRMSDFPDCLPEDVDELDAILIKINEYLEDPESLLELIQEDDLRRTKLENFTSKLSGTQPPYASGLSDQEWDELVEMICVHLVVEEMPELVTIEPTTDNQFAAGIDDDKLKINYSIKTTEKYPLQYAKLEIYKNDGTLVYLNSDSIEIGENLIFEWDGKMNQGNDVDKYIRFDESPFNIKVIASRHEDFSDHFEATSAALVHEFADEWTDASDEIKDRIYVNNAPPNTTKFEYYTMLRGQMLQRIGDRNIDDSGPLGYMDANDSTFTFLGREISVHKNYQPILTEIENDIIKGGDYAYYKNKYHIGSYSIRFMNHSQVISDHSFGLSIDIDPDNNPQINEPQNLFLKIVTNVDFWHKDRTLTQMKNASNQYKQNINSASLAKIIGGFNFINSYDNGEEPKFTTQNIMDGHIKAVADPILSNYNTISQRTSYLVNELWFENNVTDELLTELQTEIPERCQVNIEQIEVLLTKVQRYRNFLSDGYKKAYSMTTNFNEEYQYWNSYLSTIIETLKANKEAFNLIISEIEKTQAEDFLPASFDINVNFPVVDAFDASQVNNFTIFISRINEILEHNRTNLTYSQYVSWLNQNGTKTALNQLGQTGFFNLENNFVDYFLDSNKIEWGGNWNRRRDWMHFQPSSDYFILD